MNVSSSCGWLNALISIIPLGGCPSPHLCWDIGFLLLLIKHKCQKQSKASEKQWGKKSFGGSLGPNSSFTDKRNISSGKMKGLKFTLSKLVTKPGLNLRLVPWSPVQSPHQSTCCLPSGIRSRILRVIKHIFQLSKFKEAWLLTHLLLLLEEASSPTSSTNCPSCLGRGERRGVSTRQHNTIGILPPTQRRKLLKSGEAWESWKLWIVTIKHHPWTTFHWVVPSKKVGGRTGGQDLRL